MDFVKAMQFMRDGYEVQSISRTGSNSTLKINNNNTGFILCKNGTESVYVTRDEDVFATDYEVIPKQSEHRGVPSKDNPYATIY